MVLVSNRGIVFFFFFLRSRQKRKSKFTSEHHLANLFRLSGSGRKRNSGTDGTKFSLIKRGSIMTCLRLPLLHAHTRVLAARGGVELICVHEADKGGVFAC